MDNVQGVVPMLVTLFDQYERMDEARLRRLIDYEIDAGVHGFGISLLQRGGQINMRITDVKAHIFRPLKLIERDTEPFSLIDRAIVKVI